MNFWLLIGLLLVVVRWWLTKHPYRLFALVGIAIVSMWTLLNKPTSNLAESTTTIQGHLHVSPENFTIRNERIIGEGTLFLDNEPLKVRFYASDYDYFLQQTADYSIQGELSLPEEARNFGVFNYRKYLESVGVHYQLTIDTIESVQLDTSWSGKISNLRQKLRQPFEAFPNNDWLALHNKVLLNIDSEAYRKYQDGFSKLGILHLFAISGFHIHYIYNLFRYLLLRIGITIETMNQLWSLFLFFYSWLVCWPIGVVRVLLTHYLKIVQQQFNLSLSALDLLGISGILILLMNPLQSLSLGFLFSYLMTYLIRFYLQSVDSNRFEWEKTIEIALLCLVFSWPFTINITYEWNPGQWLSVIILGIIFEKVLISLLMGTTIGVLLGGHTFKTLINGMNTFIVGMVDQLSLDRMIHLTNYIVGYLSPWQVGLLIFINLIWFYLLLDCRKRSYAFLSVTYAACLFVYPYCFPKEQITIIDVGQADSVLYQANHQTWLIDTGGKLDFNQLETPVPVDVDDAKRHLIPALKALGVNQIDGLVITHPDLDHMGNLSIVSDYFPIKQLYVTEYTYHDELFVNSQFTAQPVVLKYGQLVKIEQLPMALIVPEDNHLLKGDDASNDSSIGTLIAIGDQHFLTLGDLSSQGERQLAIKYPHLQADILNLSHHGSNTSSAKEFLEFVNPSLATISSGKNNRYHHPHQEVIENLKEEQIPYLNTAEAGAIQISRNILGKLMIQTSKGN